MQSKPILPRKNKTFDTWITNISPEWQRKAIVKLTGYLSKEANIRMDLDEGSASWSEYRTAVLALTSEKENHSLVGFVTFHTFDEGNPILYHCYVIPSFRRRGLLKEAWAMIKVRYESFEIEEPISGAMQAFLKTVDCSHVLPNQ